MDTAKLKAAIEAITADYGELFMMSTTLQHPARFGSGAGVLVGEAIAQVTRERIADAIRAATK